MSRLKRIVAACGGILLDGGARALIPGPNHSHKDRSVSLIETEDGRLLIYCFSPKDDWRDVRRALADLGLLDEVYPNTGAPAAKRIVKIAAQPASEERIARAARIWGESRSLHHTVATAYLRRRAIPEALWSSKALRFHPAMTSLDDRVKRPALIAAITDGEDVLQGVQVTLLTLHGTAKAAVATPRRVIGKLMGGAVRLFEAGGRLAVGEGVETVLSAADALSAPAWAALSAENLARFQPPAQVHELIIAADNDEPGRIAAKQLAERVESRVRVSLAFAPDGADDWNAWACTRL